MLSQENKCCAITVSVRLLPDSSSCAAKQGELPIWMCMSVNYGHLMGTLNGSLQVVFMHLHYFNSFSDPGG